MTDPQLPSDRESEIRAGAGGGSVPAADLVAAARSIRSTLVESVPEAQRPELAALLEAAARSPRTSSARVRAAVGLVAALVAAGSMAAAMAGVLPAPVQDTLHQGGEVVGIHLPGSDELGDVDIVDTPTDHPLWDDGHSPDAPADGHSHIS